MLGKMHTQLEAKFDQTKEKMPETLIIFVDYFSYLGYSFTEYDWWGHL